MRHYAGCAAAGKLRRLYKTALRLEVAFFDAQHAAAASPRIGMLVTDFDDTCTASDTISTIIQTATEAKVRAAETSGRSQQLLVNFDSGSSHFGHTSESACHFTRKSAVCLGLVPPFAG